MKADPTAQAALLDLQAQDSTLAQLEHRRRSLPEHAKIEELQARAAELDGTRIEAATAVDDLTREQRKADAEVEQVKTRRTRDEERLNSGAISNPKDLASIQHELTALERRISTLEDDELEVMERLEEAQKTLDAAQAELATVQVELDQTSAARDSALTVLDEQISDHRAERGTSATLVPAELTALYDKVRAQYGGLGAAALRAKKCEGCRLELNGADLRELAALPEDEVLRCPECTRILVRTAESGL